MPYRNTDVSIGRMIIGEIVKYVFAGAVAGMIAWAGISAKQQVMETNVNQISSRAAEDRAAFTVALQNMTSELRVLNDQLQQLALQQARMEVERKQEQK